MEHRYEQIEGWFDFKDLYLLAIQGCTKNGVIVEVGAWKGKSASFMAVELVNRRKDIDFYVVDTFKGSIEHTPEQVAGLYETYKENVKGLPIRTLVMESVEAAKEFTLVDFVFIDASHSYEDVMADIDAWYPKIKKGGVLAGHDYEWKGVRRAVNECFDTVFTSGKSWFVVKN